MEPLYHITPGQFVRHPTEQDWGRGRVQTVVGNMVTVNFENQGKVVVDGSRVDLVVILPEE